MMKINNKLKQFFSGTWGSKEGKEHKITKQDFEKIEKPHVKSKPKKKKKKKPYIYKGDLCPFCKEEIPYKEKNVSHLPKWEIWWRDRKDFCECGAVKIKEGCPACHRDTWYKKGTFIHQQRHGCGYKGVGMFGDRLKVIEQLRKRKEMV